MHKRSRSTHSTGEAPRKHQAPSRLGGTTGHLPHTHHSQSEHPSPPFPSFTSVSAMSHHSPPELYADHSPMAAGYYGSFAEPAPRSSSQDQMDLQHYAGASPPLVGSGSPQPSLSPLYSAHSTQVSVPLPKRSTVNKRKRPLSPASLRTRRHADTRTKADLCTSTAATGALSLASAPRPRPLVPFLALHLLVHLLLHSRPLHRRHRVHLYVDVLITARLSPSSLPPPLRSLPRPHLSLKWPLLLHLSLGRPLLPQHESESQHGRKRTDSCAWRSWRRRFESVHQPSGGW